MNTELATLNNTHALSQGGYGFEDEDDDIVPSYIELVQRTSQVEGAIPGKFRDRDSNQYFDEIELIPLEFSSSRVLFPPGGDLTQDPLCRSNDGRVPALNVLQQQSSSCETCPRGTWDNYNKATGQGMPDCKEKMSVLFIERSTQAPYRISLGGKSLAPLKKIKAQLKKYLKLARLNGEAVSIFDFATTLRSVPVKGPKGSYYVAMFDPVVRVKATDLGKFGPMYRDLVLSRKSGVKAAPAEVGAGEAVDPTIVEAEYEEA